MLGDTADTYPDYLAAAAGWDPTDGADRDEAAVYEARQELAWAEQYERHREAELDEHLDEPRDGDDFYGVNPVA